MQNYLWNKCHCYDGNFITLSTISSCGSAMIKDAGSYCFQANNIVSLPECVTAFGKTLKQLQCMKKVKHEFMTTGFSMDLCNCPEVCEHTYYDTEVSLSTWPSNGPEMDIAYEQLVRQRMIPLIKGEINISWPGQISDEVENNANLLKMIKEDPWLSKQILDYLSNPDNKKEILSDFVRVTVYSKDLTLEVIEDVAGYTWLDALSDVGM